MQNRIPLTFIYLNRSYRLSRSQIRFKFGEFSIDKLRISGTIFPARDTVGILVHEAYRLKFITKVPTAKIVAIPLGHNHLADAQFAEGAETQRIRLAHHFFLHTEFSENSRKHWVKYENAIKQDLLPVLGEIAKSD